MGFPFWEISYLYVDNNAHDKLTKVSQGRVLLMKQNPNRRFFGSLCSLLLKKVNHFQWTFSYLLSIARSEVSYASTMIQCLVEATDLHEADIKMYIFS